MIREIADYIISLFKSRIFPLAIVFFILLSVLVHRLFVLQIINGESYVIDLNESVKKEMSVKATRGRIFDRNGVLLAYNELAYAVTISDSGTYYDSNGKKAKDVKNDTINNAIDKTLNIIEDKGDTYNTDFIISYSGNDIYDFNTNNASVLRFKRDVYGVKSVDELSDEQKRADANEVVSMLSDRYGIKSGEYDPKHLLEILSLRISMSENSYNRYISFTISNDVSDETVAAISENSDVLVGVSVEEQYVRKYVDGIYCSQIIGYTGVASKSEYEELSEDNSEYELNDVVGKTGIEQSMELELAGEKGTKEVYVDKVGRITQVISESEATAGHDIYLTIDVNLQKEMYEAVERKVAGIILANFRQGNQKYDYKEGGIISHIYITANEAYFGMIDNNMVSLSKLADSDSSNSQAVYGSFLDKKEQVNNWIESELKVYNSEYSSLSEEDRNYLWYIYEMLLNDGILNKNSIDTSNEKYSQWIEGSEISFHEFLTECISNGWIEMNMLTTQNYSSIQESYDLLVDYILQQINSDTSFYKKIYKYMIDNGNISGRQVCMLLFEQGVLEDTGEYAALSSGSLDPYRFVYSSLENLKIKPSQLGLKPCSGSCVIADPENGDVLALVSYPSYDNNKMSGSVDPVYYEQLSNDKSMPLYNWATQSQSAPGSTFKVCSAIAGLDTGIINTSTQFNCTGAFTKVTPSPKCWNVTGHGIETVTTALRDSCNVYFCSVGYNLACSKDGVYNSSYGTDILQHYAEELGLATKSGIEIYEATPHASNINSFLSAIGQGNHLYSCLNLARYACTVANSGTCYNFTLIDKITDYDGNIIKDNEAEVSNVMDVDNSIFKTVQYGMSLAANSYTALRTKVKVAAKTGTAQEKATEPDHSFLISYAPYDGNPDIAMGVAIKNGYEGTRDTELAADLYDIYYKYYPDGHRNSNNNQ